MKRRSTIESGKLVAKKIEAQEEKGMNKMNNVP